MKNPIYSPNNIDVLLHYNRSSERHPRYEAPAVKEAVDWFVKLKCLKPMDTDGCYKITTRGKAWIDALCRVVCPQYALIDGFSGQVLLFLDNDLEFDSEPIKVDYP